MLVASKAKCSTIRWLEARSYHYRDVVGIIVEVVGNLEVLLGLQGHTEGLA
jgi:hypothetical protein